MKQRSLFLIRFYLLTLIIFLVAKVAFMIANLTDHSFTAIDVANVIWHGLSLDLSTSICVLLLPFLVIMVSLWWDGDLLRRILRVYYGLIAIMLALAFVADTCLYPFWGFKLDASCLQYLETPVEARASVSGLYMVIALIVLVTLTYALYRLYKSIPFWESRPSHQQTATLGNILLIPVFIIGIRGGLDESTTNVGQVYFSQNQFLNHAAVNPVFSFLSSFEKSANDIIVYNYMSEQECCDLTDSLFFTHSNNIDTLLTTKRPNILLIVMESCGGQFTSIGGHEEITPNLNQFLTEGVSFSECYANSWRTDKGMVSILSGYPSFPVTSVMKIPEKSRKMPSIAHSLHKVGYKNTFYYGGDINFTNMRSYVMGSGYDLLRWKADYSLKDQSTCKWGVKDEIMFQSVLEDIKAEKSQHWMKTLLTLSSHEPWDVPTHELNDEVYNAFNYLDQCIGKFINKLRQMPAWNDLLVIILPDHGYRYRGINETTRLYNHIPLLWIGGAVRQPKVITPLCNQSDLAATLLGQMDISHNEYRFSRDVTSSDYHYPLVYHNSTNCVSVIDTMGFIAYDLDAHTIIANESTNSKQQLKMAHALLQLTSHDFIDK